MASSTCDYIWIPFAFVTIIMMISLLKNILYCLEDKKRKGKTHKGRQEYGTSNGEFYTEECPVYDNLNLNHHQETLNESCYEQMNAHAPTFTNEIQSMVEHQMCYASLDHSIKRKHKNLRKKKYPASEAGEDQSRSSSVPFDTCIYLNSEQLSVENILSTNTIKDDPVRLFDVNSQYK